MFKIKKYLELYVYLFINAIDIFDSNIPISRNHFSYCIGIWRLLEAAVMNTFLFILKH